MRYLPLLLLLPGALLLGRPARAQLTIAGGTLTITTGTTVSVGGAVSVQSAGTVDNQGTLLLTGDLSNTGTVGTSTGLGEWQLNGTALQTLTNTGSGTLNALNVNNAAGATLAAPLTAGTLNLSAGPLRLAGNDLTVGAGGITNANTTNRLVVTNGTGQLRQTVGTAAVLFPVGPADNTLRAAALTRSAGSGLYGVRATAGALAAGNTGAPLAADAVNLRWNVTVPDAVPYALGLQWATADELPSFDRTNAAVGRWTGSSYSASAYGPATAVGAFWALSGAGLTAGGPFIVGDRQSPLPVVLTAFEARRPAGQPRAELTWTTASEVNNLGFEVQRQDEGQPGFTRVGFVAGAGNSAQARSYAFTDPNTFSGNSYYRLKQVDADGKTVFSPVRVVAGLPEGTSFSLALFPNPAHEQVTLAASGAVPAGLTLSLFGADGRRVWAGRWPAAQTRLTLPLPGLATGAYWLRYEAPDAPAGALKLLLE